MKSLFTLLSVTLWLALLILAVMNIGDVTHVNLVGSSAAIFLSEKFNINVAVTSIYLKSPVLYFLLFALGAIAELSYLMPKLGNTQDKIAAYKRELEKGSVTNSESSSKIEVLENKIRVLEKALNDALNK